MPKWKLYNPEGMQDILVNRCYTKKNIENKIRQLLRANGYMEIETPMVEFYDVFSNNEQLINQETMFKFVDEKGRILALRPDMTIPTARVIGTKLKEMTLPIKVSYIGNCFKYNDFGLGRQREFTQAGVEIFAENNPFYDAQVISMAIKSLLATGLEQFTIELGQVEFFKGLMEEAGFGEELIEKIRQMIEIKDYYGLEEVLKDQEIEKDVKLQILNLSNTFGNKEMLVELSKSKLNQRSLQAVLNLIEIVEILEQFGFEQYISIDLGMVKRLTYYTGMIFKGLTYGIGFPILSGGRYDGLCEKFGRPLSATGFSLGIDVILTVLQRNNVETEKNSYDTVIVCKEKGRDSAIKIAKVLRNKGLKVDLIYGEVNQQYAIERKIKGMINLIDENQIEVIDLANDTVTKTSIAQLLGGGQ